MCLIISDVLDIDSRQNKWCAKENINIIASKNLQSYAVKQIEPCDFIGSYAEGHTNNVLSIGVWAMTG